MTVETTSYEWVYKHLICEFSHWDLCLTGLVDRDGEKLLFRLIDEDNREHTYSLHKINWTPECTEYLRDLGVAYKHCFYKDGKPICRYDNWPLESFWQKWQCRNPIVENAQT